MKAAVGGSSLTYSTPAEPARPDTTQQRLIALIVRRWDQFHNKTSKKKNQQRSKIEADLYYQLDLLRGLHRQTRLWLSLFKIFKLLVLF